jgi:hypothetical protein
MIVAAIIGNPLASRDEERRDDMKHHRAAAQLMPDL